MKKAHEKTSSFRRFILIFDVLFLPLYHENVRIYVQKIIEKDIIKTKMRFILVLIIQISCNPKIASKLKFEHQN